MTSFWISDLQYSESFLINVAFFTSWFSLNNLNWFKNLVVSDSLKYDAFSTSEAENEIKYQIVCYIIIINDSVWIKTFADDVFECVENVLNVNYSSFINFFSFSLSELTWEWDMFI